MARDIGDAAETRGRRREHRQYLRRQIVDAAVVVDRTEFEGQRGGGPDGHGARQAGDAAVADIGGGRKAGAVDRSEEHTSELQSLMRISYAVFCLKKKKNNTTKHILLT